MLINMRNAMLSGGKRTPTARDYVQDGLVAMWDGIENAGWGIHDPESTVWKDLTGNGWDIPSGDLLFHSDHVEALADSQSVKSSVEFWEWDAGTFEAVCERPSTPTVVNNGFFQLGRIGLANINNSQSNGYAWFIAQSASNWRALYYPSHDQSTKKFDLAHRGFVTNFASPMIEQKVFRNGIYIPNNSYRGESWTTTIPYGSLSMKLCKGSRGTPKYWNIRLYSRALTANEIRHNYAIDKARFNLP